MKSLKKAGVAVLVGSLVFGVPQVAIADEDTSLQEVELAANEASEEVDNLIADLGDDIEITEDGIVYEEGDIEDAVADMDINAINDFYVLNGMESVTEDDLVRMFEEGIESVNEEIRDGELDVLANGTIVEADDDAYYLQGGSTYTQTHWWGRRIYKSTAAANRWVYQLNQAGHLNTGAAVLAGAVFGGVGAVPNGLTAVWVYSLANRVQYVNSTTKRGIIADVRWVLYYTVRTQ